MCALSMGCLQAGRGLSVGGLRAVRGLCMGYSRAFDDYALSVVGVSMGNPRAVPGSNEDGA